MNLTKKPEESTEVGSYTYSHLLFYCIINGLKDLTKPTICLQSDKIVIKNDEVKIWMIGHASVLVNFYGVTIITDPVLVNWIPLPKRIVASGYTAEKLPHIDYVVVSHGHYDHFNIKSLKQLSKKADTIIVPKNYLHLVKRMEYKQKLEMNWDEHKEFKDFAVWSYKPVHIGGRLPWEKIDQGYNCYVFKRNDKSILFSGDSGYGSFFAKIGNKHKVDIALLGIGAYKPYSFLRHWHMNPEDALEAFKDLKTEHLIPIHWGNFRLGLEGMEEPLEVLKQLAKEQGLEHKVHILRNGQSLKLV